VSGTLRQNERTQSFLRESKFVERIQKAFDSIVEEHAGESSDKYNKDETYKQLTSEAIDLKSFAIEKMDTFIAFSTSDSSMKLNNSLYQNALGYINECALPRFKTPDVVQRALETTSFDFPWDKMDSEEIDLSEWSLDAHEYDARIDTIAKELKKNTNLKKVIKKGTEFNLKNGWNTETVEWNCEDGAADIENYFAIVAQLLLSNCCCLKSLKINFR
jgi:hypothetical protein